MRHLLPILALPILALLIAPPALAAAPPPAGTVKSCLALSMIRNTQVIDGETIDFILRDGSVWRSTLPGGPCPQLAFERAFSYQTTLSQLCQQDLIVVLQNMGGLMPGASCGLGPFVAQPPPPPRTPRPKR